LVCGADIEVEEAHVPLGSIGNEEPSVAELAKAGDGGERFRKRGFVREISRGHLVLAEKHRRESDEKSADARQKPRQARMSHRSLLFVGFDESGCAD
jgi:hypothetical protein